MMASQTHRTTRLNREEAIGLIVAAVAHVAIVAWMALEPPGRPVVLPPERMTVTFADEVALESTSPEPFADAAPDVAPELGEAVSEPEPQELAPPEPEPQVQPEPMPEPQPAPKPVAKPVPKPAPKPVAKPAPKPVPKPAPKAAAKPVEKPAPKAAPKAAPKEAATDDRQRRADAPAGGSRIGSDFLKGVPGAQATGSSRSAPAAGAGPSAAALSQAIARELKPHWTAPQGADAEKLVTVLAFELNRDGSLAGRPRVVSQSGVTPANEAQKDRHAEQAIRAVQLAAPFDLPDQFYASWRRVSAFRFDRKLSQ